MLAADIENFRVVGTEEELRAMAIDFLIEEKAQDLGQDMGVQVDIEFIQHQDAALGNGEEIRQHQAVKIKRSARFGAGCDHFGLVAHLVMEDRKIALFLVDAFLDRDGDIGNADVALLQELHCLPQIGRLIDKES